MNRQNHTEQVLLRAHSGGYREYRIPGILRVRDALLFACEARAEDRGDWGDIDVLVLRARDGEAPRQVLKIGEAMQPSIGTMRTYNNPTLIPDGENVHLIYHRNYERAYLVTSRDGGCTFSAPREITAAYRAFAFDWNVCATGPGHGIRLSNGRLLAPIWLANGPEKEGVRRHWPSVAGCIYSDDHGATWHPGALARGLDSGNETCVAELHDGSVLFNIRSRDERRLRTLAVSDDGGETLRCMWACPALRDPWCFAGMTASPSGTVLVHCDAIDRRENLTVKASADAGKSWRALWHVDDVGGYADIACEGNTLHVFYERTCDEEQLVREMVWQQKALD